MNFQLQPHTPAGARFVGLAEHHAVEVARLAAQHDRDGTFPIEAVEAMKTTGFLTATVPEEFGGLGLTSVHDLVVGMSRLARGDGSIAIASNMHLLSVISLALELDDARVAGADGVAMAVGMLLGQIASGMIVLGANSEVGTDSIHPFTTVTPTDGGWLLNGRKTFCTLSPVADMLFVSCRAARPEPGPSAEPWQSHYAAVVRTATGVTVHDDWNALGMRASGSHSITLENVFVPALMLSPATTWGREGTNRALLTLLSAGLIGSFLGIAERAQQIAMNTARTRTRGPSPSPLATRSGIQRLIAESEMDLTVCRSLLGHLCPLIDRVVMDKAAGPPPLASLQGLVAQLQAAKYEINHRAIHVVDRAMAVSGGTGYLASNELSRLYRDVRAGPFMQPYAPHEVHEYIARVTLGLDPTVEG